MASPDKKSSLTVSEEEDEIAPASSTEDIAGEFGKKKRFSKSRLVPKLPGLSRARAHTMDDAAALRSAASRARNKSETSDGTLSPTPSSESQKGGTSPGKGKEEKEKEKEKDKDDKSHRLTHRISKAFKQLMPQKDDAHFHNLFKNVPEDQHLIDDFMCALQRDILVQGRLYISQSYFSFYSNILGWETMLTINCRDVVAIRKEKTALVIPNAIQIVTVDAKYTFASFLSRDSAFRCFFKVWQNALLDEPLSVEQLMEGTSKDYRGGTGRQADEPSSSPEDSDNAVFNLRVEDPNGESVSLSSGQTTPKSADFSRSQSDRTMPNSSPNMPRNVSAPASVDSSPVELEPPSRALDEIVDCGCLPAQHEQGRVFIEATVPGDIDTVFRLLFTSNPWFSDFYDARETLDLKATDWSAGHPGAKQDPEGREHTFFREMSYVLKLNHAIGPKRANAVEKQWSVQEPGKRYIVLTDVATPNVPFGETFYTLSRYCLSRNGSQTTLRVSSHMRYRKSPPWAITRSMIEKNGYSGLKEYWEHLLSSVTEYLEQNPEQAVTLPTLPSTDISTPDRPAAMQERMSRRASLVSRGSISSERSIAVRAEAPSLWSQLASPMGIIIVVLLILNLAVLLRVWYLEGIVVEQYRPPVDWLARRLDCDDDATCHALLTRYSASTNDRSELIAHATIVAEKLTGMATSMQRILTLLTNSSVT